MLEPFISDCGFSVTSFTDSTKAIEEIDRIHFDIVLTDLIMPKINGIDILKKIKKSSSDTKVIIVTGYGSIDSAIDSFRLGIYDYIRKPYRMDDIVVVLNRAKHQLDFERENNILNKKIQRMLTDMTMLYNISTIMYQIPDFQIVIEMVLDTLTEGMNIENVALFMDNNQSGKFVPHVARGILDESLPNILNIQKDTVVNDVTISFEKQTVLTECDSKLHVSGNTIELANNISQCIISPVRYFNETLAFIGVLQPENHILNDNEIKLLAILATQIAPVFRNFNSEYCPYSAQEMGSLQMIKFKIDEAKTIGGSVSFALLKIFGESEGDFKGLTEKLDNFIKDETADLNPIIWKGINIWIVAVPNIDLVSLEISCASIRQRMEDENINGETGKISIRHVITSFPLDGQTAEEIYYFLSERIYQESNKVSNNK